MMSEAAVMGKLPAGHTAGLLGSRSRFSANVLFVDPGDGSHGRTDCGNSSSPLLTSYTFSICSLLFSLKIFGSDYPKHRTCRTWKNYRLNGEHLQKRLLAMTIMKQNDVAEPDFQEMIKVTKILLKN